MSGDIKAAAPEGTAASHKEDNTRSPSDLTVPDWQQSVIDWYSGGPKPPRTLLRLAPGVPEHIPKKHKDRVVVLALAGLDTEDIIAAVPALNPIHIVETIDRIPGEVYSLIDLHHQGYTPLEISDEIDVSRPTIYYWLDKTGQRPNRASREELTARQRDQIVQAYRNGEPKSSIARRFNASYDQVRYAVEVAA